MNHKFLKNLRLFCLLRGENLDLWKRAYKTMPLSVQKNFQKDVAKFADEYRKSRSQLTN